MLDKNKLLVTKKWETKLSTIKHHMHVDVLLKLVLVLCGQNRRMHDTKQWA